MRPPRGYRCQWCVYDHDTFAVVRVFSGIMGGGYAACEKHRQKANTAALESLLDGRPIVDGYVVQAFEVAVDEHGDRRVSRLLWSARRKQAA